MVFFVLYDLLVWAVGLTKPTMGGHPQVLTEEESEDSLIYDENNRQNSRLIEVKLSATVL